MKTMIDVYRNVSAWNAARYDQQLDLALATTLLCEEYDEHFEKGALAVDKLDALGDISYVALGICWKADISEELLVQKLTYWQDYLVDALNSLPGLAPIFLIPGFVSSFAYDMEFGVSDSMAAILNLCYFQAAYSYKLTTQDWLAALTAVCKSNDSKSIMKVEANVKANAGNKGPNYVPPTADLVRILNACLAKKGLN